MRMGVKLEDRIKIKGYVYERRALMEFLNEPSIDAYSPHIRNAVSSRLRTVEKEMRILVGKQADKYLMK